MTNVKKHSNTTRAFCAIRTLSMKKNCSNVNLLSLGFYTDQLVEAMHQYTDRRITNSNYFVKDINSDIQGENLLKGINHINSYNLD